MNSYLKPMPLILAVMMCGSMAAWAGANANAPYCEHDPDCWVPNDDPSSWYGSDCCRRKYTLDCKAESIKAGTAWKKYYSSMQRLARATGAADSMQTECELGWDPQYGGPPGNRDWMREPGGGDPCKAAEVWRERVKEREREYKEAEEEYKAAEKEYNMCLSCQNK